MSRSDKQFHEMGIDSLADRFHESCSFDHNKPDFRELDLGSSLLPFIPRRHSDGGGTNSNITSSCSSVSNNNNNSISFPNVKRSNCTNATNHSGDLSGSTDMNPTASETPRSVTATRNLKPGHRRSMSSGSPLIYSGCGSHYNTTTTSSGSGSGSGSGGAASVSSPNTVNYPSGNICPSGKILKSNMGCRSSSRSEKLGLGSANYGHGSIVRGGGGGGGGGGSGGAAKLEISSVIGNIHLVGELGVVKMGAVSSSDPEEVKKAGNELYKRGHFSESLSLYDRAIVMSPENAAYRSNRAAALTMLGRLGEAVRECEEAVRLDPGYLRAHQRLASLYLRLGQVENGRRQLCFHGQQPDKTELQKMLLLEKHLNRCVDARKIGDWKSVLRECDAAMVAGADSSLQITACKAEASLKLRKLEDADSILSRINKSEAYPTSCLQTKFFGMLSEAYVLYVQAQVDMAFGRFENAVAAAEKAGLVDYSNIEIAMLLNNVKLITRARSRGKDHFDSGRFAEACTAYGEGLKYDLSNSLLFCNRAVCWSKLGLWEKSVEDCNQALKFQPNYTKALLRRAVSNAKLERWAEAVRDYAVLRREFPGDNDVAESLFHSQIALKKLRQEEAHNARCSNEVQEEVSILDGFKDAISSPGGMWRRAQQ
ncbi:hypothetical protein ACSBR1_012679 [Camellia fascicularis]